MKRLLDEALRETIPPEDGRNIDSEVGRLAGEGALQRVRDVEPAPFPPREWAQPSPPLDESPTYYGVPALKEPVWKWYIPAYFFVGGLSGAAAVVGASADLFGDHGMVRLSRQCRILAAAGAATSAALLIADLGRPSRFLNMLRVFRPSSPMNVGTWFLSAFGTLSGVAVLPALFPTTAAPLRRVGDLAWIGAGLVGLPMTGYTGVLLADTAVPIWQGARRSLPVLFSSSGAASLASVFDLLGDEDPGAEVTHRVGIVAKTTELAMTVALEREVALVPRVARPLRTGFTGALWRAGQFATAASLILSVAVPRRTWARRVAGTLGIAGALAMRFSLFHAGKRSARDAKATFEQQRAGHGAAQVVDGQPGRQLSSADDTLSEGSSTERSE